MTGDLMVEAHGLRKTYATGSGRSVVALDDVGLVVPRGSLVAVTGRSGSGKTTLLHCLGGLERPDAGSVRVDGVEVTGLDEGGLLRLRRERVGFVFQSFALVPVLTARENVGVPLRLRRTPVREREERVGRLLDVVGLGRHAEQRPDELSGGQQQRVAVARALAASPSLLLADGRITHRLVAPTAADLLAALNPAAA